MFCRREPGGGAARQGCKRGKCEGGRRQQKLIRWISFGFCVFNHTPISFIKSSHQHLISPSIFPSHSLSHSAFFATVSSAAVEMLLLLLLLLLYRRHFDITFVVFCCCYLSPSCLPLSLSLSLFHTFLFIVFLFLCKSFRCVRIFHSLSRAIYARLLACHAPSITTTSSSLSLSPLAVKLFTKWNCFRINNFIKIKLLLLWQLALRAAGWAALSPSLLPFFSLSLALSLVAALTSASFVYRLPHFICLSTELRSSHSLPPTSSLLPLLCLSLLCLLRRLFSLAVKQINCAFNWFCGPNEKREWNYAREKKAEW